MIALALFFACVWSGPGTPLPGKNYYPQVDMGGGALSIELATIDSTWGLYLATIKFTAPTTLPCPSCSSISLLVFNLHPKDFEVIDQRHLEREFVAAGATSTKSFVIRAVRDSTVTIEAAAELSGVEYRHDAATDKRELYCCEAFASMNDSAAFHVTPMLVNPTRTRFVGCPDSILQIYVWDNPASDK